MRELANRGSCAEATDNLLHYQKMAKDFTPIPVGADFAALRRFVTKDAAHVCAEVEVAKAA